MTNGIEKIQSPCVPNIYATFPKKILDTQKLGQTGVKDFSSSNFNDSIFSCAAKSNGKLTPKEKREVERTIRDLKKVARRS